MRKKKLPRAEIIRRVVMIVLVVIFVCAAAYLIWLVVESRMVNKASKEAVEQYVLPISNSLPEASEGTEVVTDDDEEEEPEVAYTIDFAALWETSPYVVGWIQISGLEQVDYPLVQYMDNSFFLTHAWDASYSRYGAIFVDCNCAGNFTDPYTLIYGHTMKDGSKFGGLKKFQDQSFYEENGCTITIYLPTETRIYEMFSIHVVGPVDPGTYTIGYSHGAAFESYVQAMASKSLYDTGLTVDGFDNVITLSTCTGNDRLVINAKLVSTIPLG